MAEVIPFQAIMYNPEIIADLNPVCTPPYDVISPEEQERFHECHPYNIIRLILGKQYENDTTDENCHTRAARCFQTWQKEKVLTRDKAPSFYLTSVAFEEEGEQKERFGLIGLVRLEPFEKGIILPHETTYSKVKTERLKLMEKTHANFSPIFSLYPDQTSLFSELKTFAESTAPDQQFTDYGGKNHKIWRITENSMQKRIQEAMEKETIYIADGHHRYETALTYRDERAKADPDFSNTHPANYLMMYLTSMADPGMVIRPAHRMVSGLSEKNMDEFEEKVQKDFILHSFPATSPLEIQTEKLFDELENQSGKHAIAVITRKGPMLALLTPKEEAIARLRRELSPSLADLDVSILTHLILMDTLGFDAKGLDDTAGITYTSLRHEAADMVLSGKRDMAFILNPTTISQVRKVSENREIMPRKSTYFYPKVITGLVINSLENHFKD